MSSSVMNLMPLWIIYLSVCSFRPPSPWLNSHASHIWKNIHRHTHTNKHMHTYCTYIHTNTHTHSSIQMHINKHPQMQTHTQLHSYTHKSTHNTTCTQIKTHHTFTHIHSQIHTHTQVNTNTHIHTNIDKIRSTHSYTVAWTHTHTHSDRRIYQGPHCFSVLTSTLDRAHISMLCYKHNNSSLVERRVVERHPASVLQIRSLTQTHDKMSRVTPLTRSLQQYSALHWLDRMEMYLFSATWRWGCWGLNNTSAYITCLPFSCVVGFKRLLWQVLNWELTYFMSFCDLIV